MSIDDLQAQLRGALDQQFAALKQHYEGAILDARQQAAVEAQRTVDAKLAQATAEMEARVQQLVSTARAETEQRMSEAAASERAAIEQAMRVEYERQLAARIASVQADAERRAREAAAAEWQAAEQRLRQQIDHDFQVQLEHVINSTKRSAELQRESEQRRAQNELEAERERFRTELAAERDRLTTELEAERERAGAELDAAVRRAGAEFDVERDRFVAELDAERERGGGEIEAERQRAAEELARVRAELQAEIHRLEAMPPPVSVQAAPPVSVAPLAQGIQQLDDSRTLTQALDALVAAAADIAARAALFIIDGDRLKAWKGAGIPDVDVRSVESSIGGRDLLARAIQQGSAIRTSPDLPAPPFARAPAERRGLAAPVTIGGRAVAVLYVDEGEQSFGAQDPDFVFDVVDALTRHASSVIALRTATRTLDLLRGVTVDGADGAAAAHGEEDARRFARLLVAEIKLYNEGAVRVGRQQRDLLHRLRDEIETARRVYEERVPASIAARGAYFQQELVQTLAEGDPALLGHT